MIVIVTVVVPARIVEQGKMNDNTRIGGEECVRTYVVRHVTGGVYGCDIHLSSSRNGVRVGTQEKEDPFVNLGLMLNALGDIVPVLADGGVFKSVGQDRNNDQAGPRRLAPLGNAGSEIIDGLADRIQKRRAATRHEGAGVEVGDFFDGNGGVGHLIAVIKQCQSEPGLPRLFFLIGEECIESGNSGFEAA